MEGKGHSQKFKFELADFRNGAKNAEVFNDVTAKIVKSESEKLIDEVEQKRGENWSLLANQVVGSENLGT